MKIIQAYVYNKSHDNVEWEWWCCPFLNVRLSGLTKTPEGGRRAAIRTLERMGFKANVEILRPNLTSGTYGFGVIPKISDSERFE